MLRMVEQAAGGSCLRRLAQKGGGVKVWEESQPGEGGHPLGGWAVRKKRGEDGGVGVRMASWIAGEDVLVKVTLHGEGGGVSLGGP